uniref:Uncharacterized protein n=1 Tax=Tanacetum cinerariifolium TaxID=118510 RepID=A0A6L2NFT4_TANCI|nr:hypothetical protein [Tanacetum cinerariifolium]
MGTKSRAARPSARRHIVFQAAGRSSVESFYWTLRLRSLLELCLAVGLRSSSYLHYNLISGFGSLNNQISSTRDAFTLDPDTRFVVLEINFAYSFLLLLFSCFGSSFVEFKILISLKSQLIELMQLHKSFFSLVAIGVLLSVRNAHRASSSFPDHIDRLSLTVFLRILFKALLVFSTLPLVCGWKDIVLLGDWFRLREKKNKTGLEEAAKGKATQPSDKSDKDSVTIGHLGELVTHKAEKGKSAQPSDKGDKVSMTIRDLGELVEKDAKWKKLSFDYFLGTIFLRVNPIRKNFITRIQIQLLSFNRLIEMGQNWYRKSYDCLDGKEKSVQLDDFGVVFDHDDESDSYTR